VTRPLTAEQLRAAQDLFPIAAPVPPSTWLIVWTYGDREVYWAGAGGGEDGWTADRAEALEFTTGDDAYSELRAARRSVDAHPAYSVELMEVV
jgi:hypothetical protein